LQADQRLRVLYTRDPRGKLRTSGKVVYVGLSGAGVAVDCYSFANPSGQFSCFDPKAAPTSIQTPTPKLGKTLAVTPTTAGESVEALPPGGGSIIAPIKGAPVTSLFGMRFHPILHITRLHAGIDFGAPVGSTVRAAADGAIEFAGAKPGFGNHVRIQHKGFETSYSHLDQIPSGITPGVVVKVGQMIALSGNTGLSTGPHLHFEYYLGGAATDPMPHLGGDTAAALAGAGVSSGPVIAAGGGTSEADASGFAAAKAIVDAALDAGSRL
jgi:Peptidase family M23